VSASQVISRARSDTELSSVFGDKIIRSDSLVYRVDSADSSAIFVCDYWNVRNVNRILEFVGSGGRVPKNVIIVIDEADSGGQSGLMNRLGFIKDFEKSIEAKAKQSGASVGFGLGLILVTATVANLCKSIGGLVCSAGESGGAGGLFRESRVLSRLLYSSEVEYHFVNPVDNYIGPSWFLGNVDRLRVLKFEKRKKEETRDEWIKARDDYIEGVIASMDDADKRLSLVVVSTKKDDQADMTMRLLEKCGYNVVVELNSECVKEYLVYYRSTGGVGGGGGDVDELSDIKEWKIPLGRIERLAGRAGGELSNWQDTESLEFIETGIESFDDISLSHILCASLLMKTKDYGREMCACDIEWARLNVLNNSVRRPRDYPISGLRIAIVAGHMASRGNTIQNAMIDFVCTSHCFTDSIDAAQRGAINAQRFGRACGLLLDTYRVRGREPVVIATEQILRDALSNETMLMEESERFARGDGGSDGGRTICLADFVTSSKWSLCLRRSKKKVVESAELAVAAMKARRPKVKVVLKKRMEVDEAGRGGVEAAAVAAPVIDAAGKVALMESRLIGHMRGCVDGIMELTNSALGKIDPELNAFVRAQNRWLFTHMASKGLIVNIEPRKSIWKLLV